VSRARRLRDSERRLCRALAPLRFAAPVRVVYNPLVYASRPHAQYLRRYAESRKRVVFIGMNPGPWGMAQTGVPFGHVGLVRDWLGIEARVTRPEPEHPKRPIQGFDCVRGEVSGERLWGAIAEGFGRPEAFFAEHFVANYCPLVFMEESGRNRTPDKLPRAEREPLYEACDRHLRDLVRILEPEWLVGVGRFAEGRARAALSGPQAPQGPRIASILHPSPASPRANQGWAGQARRQLRSLGICAK
jgi:single-strand selective monofunctional uracil DNA glycosylase